jgi:hypothetical protein
VKIILLDGRGLLEHRNLLQGLGRDEFLGTLVCVLESDVSTNSATLINNESVIILQRRVSISKKFLSMDDRVTVTHDDRDLTEWLFLEECGRLVFPSFHVDRDKLEWNIFLCQNHRNDTRRERSRVAIEFQGHGEDRMSIDGEKEIGYWRPS